MPPPPDSSGADSPAHVVVVVGGAVAGSEAAALAAGRGCHVVVLDQNARPYGKIEDGLPRWHHALRRKEYGRIDANLTRPGVTFVPLTKLGRDLPFAQLVGELQPSLVLLASGAWRDRPLAGGALDAFTGQAPGRGLVYQNPIVYWFNHHEEPGYDGPRFMARPGALVVGGGLASIDVVKILSLEVWNDALRARGHDVDLERMETRGVPFVLGELGLDPAEFDLPGPTLVYRRDMKDMPLANADDPSPEKLAKLERARVKLFEKVQRKFDVRFVGRTVVDGAHAGPDGMLAGLRVRNVAFEGRRVVPVDGSEHVLEGSLVVSAIGSVPEAIEGIPSRGELLAFADWDTGELGTFGGVPVFGLGNVLTGKGNIRDSRKNARLVAAQVLEYLAEREASGVDGTGVDAMSDTIHADAAARATVALRALRDIPRRTPAQVERVLGWARARQQAVGMGDGDYTAWIARSWPTG